jgi:hypothetical protein
VQRASAAGSNFKKCARLMEFIAKRAWSAIEKGHTGKRDYNIGDPQPQAFQAGFPISR